MIGSAVRLMRFLVRYGWFGFKEQFTSVIEGLAGILIFPMYMGICTLLWSKYSAAGSTVGWTAREVFAYIGFTEVLFMSFARSRQVLACAGDFSLSLARPRPWWLLSGTELFARALGNRLLFLGVLAALLAGVGVPWVRGLEWVARFLALLPVLGVFQVGYNLVLASLQIFLPQTQYFVLPLTKVFLVLGGVFGPLSDYSEPWRAWLVALPPSDLFFQPAYWVIQGQPFHFTPVEMGLRWLAHAAVLAVAVAVLHRHARREHQSHGG